MDTITKMNRFGQLYRQQIIYIIETPLQMDELSNIFDPETVWIDITDKPEVEVGYVQGVSATGEFILKPPTYVSVEVLSKEEEFLTSLYYIKLQRKKYLNKAVRRKAYLDIDDCLMYLTIGRDNITELEHESLLLNKFSDANELARYILKSDEIIEREIHYLTAYNHTDYMNMDFSEMIKLFELDEFKL